MKKLLFLLLTCSSAFASEKVTIVLEQKYIDHFVTQCVYYGVPIKIAYRLFQWESGWNPKQTYVNKDGTIDRGLGQHNSAYLADFAFRYNNDIPYDPFCWQDNMRISIAHLAFLKKQTGTWAGAVASYNMGLSGYKKFTKKKWKLPTVTQNLLDAIFKI